MSKKNTKQSAWDKFEAAANSYGEKQEYETDFGNKNWWRGRDKTPDGWDAFAAAANTFGKTEKKPKTTEDVLNGITTGVKEGVSRGWEKLWNTAMNAAQAQTRERLGTFKGGSTQDINDRVTDYKVQKKTYGEEKQRYSDWTDELRQLQAEEKWMTGKDLAENRKRQQELQAAMERSPAVKPTLPILSPGDYANQKATGSGESEKDWNAMAAALAGMEKEQRYWDDAQKRYQPGSQHFAESQKRYNEKYSEYAKQYEQLGGKLPGGQTVAQRQQQASMDFIDDNFAGANPDTNPEYKAYLERLEATQKTKDADAAAEEQKKTEQTEAQKEVDRLRNEKIRLQQLQVGYSRATGVPKSVKDKVNEELAQVTEALEQAKMRADQEEAQQRLAERQEAAESYEVYDYMPDFQETVDAEKAKEPNRKDDPVGYARKNITGQAALNASADQKRYMFMSDKEVDRYYYLLGKQGKDAAMQYLDDLEITVDKRMRDYQSENIEILYGTSNVFGKGLLNAGTLAVKPVADISSAAADVKGAVTGKYNPYSPGHAGTNFVDTTRSVTANDIYTSVNDPVWSPILSNTYQAAMSAGDSAIGAMLLGNGYTALMGASAASQKAKELYENGASDVQIGLGAAASGLIEMATEKYSIEYFTEHFLEGDITGFTDWAKKTLIQALNEGSEEVASEIANNIADAIFQGANSDNSREVAELMQQGMSYKEAVAEVLKNRAIDVFWAGYGGAVSGGMMGGIGGGINWAEQSSRQKASGRKILQNEGAQQLLNEYLGQTGETAEVKTAGKKPGFFATTEEKLRAAAEKMAALTVEQYQQMNGFQQRKAEGVLGRIYEQQVRQQADGVDTEIRQAFQEAAEKELEGQVEDPKAAAEAVTKQAFDEELTKQDEAALRRKPEEQTGTAAESQSKQNEEADVQTVTETETAAQAAQQPEGTSVQTDTEGKTQAQQQETVNAQEIIEKVQNSREFQELTERKTTDFLRTVGLAADEESSMNPKHIQQQRAIVEEAAKSYADPEAVMAAYRDGQDAESFLRNYDIAYRNGQTGMISRYSTQSREITRDMSKNQILKAHEAGRKAAGYESEAAEGSVRTGEKWNDLQNPGRKASGVAESTAAGEAGQGTGKGAGSFAAGQKVSAEALGITGGTDEKNLTYRAPEQWNADERAAAVVAKEHGMNITIVQGGSIKTAETVDGVKQLVKSRALVEGDTMIVRSDDPTMSAEQLARHEATHKRIERGEVQLGSTVRQLLKKYSPAQIREIIHLYAEAYGNANMNAAQVLEEIVCDAMAEMNAFATEQTESVAGEVGRFLRDVKKAAQGTALEGGQKKNAPGGVKYSIQNITGESGRDYGVGVYLDSQLLSGLTDSERIKMVKEFVKELGGQSLTAYEPDGSEVAIKIAEPNQKFLNKSGKSVPVTNDLVTKFRKDKTKQEAIVLIDELVATSRYQGSEPSKYTHGWLDNNGKNSWELWTTYIQDRDNVIWKASLNVATAADGKRYLYDISQIKKVEQPGNSGTSTTALSVAQQEQNVKPKSSRELETVEELKKQNELLKKQVDYWHSQTAVTVGERGADKEEVKKLARQLRRDYGSQTELQDYLPELQWLADNRQNKKAKFADMMKTAENVARQVLDGCQVNVNEEQMETMKELKKFLRGRYINVDESLKEDIGDFGDFKKLNRALHFREDGSGTGVDSLWLELQDQFGEGLFPEDVQNPADQIRHIADTVYGMEAQWVNPYDADMELTVQQMANDVMAKTLNLNRMKGTRADKAAQQATKELTYLLEKGKKRELRRIEGAKQTAQRQSIRGMAEKFKRMALKPGKGDTQHAPQQLIGAVTEFCDIFNDSELRRAERQRATLEERAKAFDEAIKSEGGGSAEEYRLILTTRQRIDKMEAALSRLKGIYAEMKDNQYDTVYEDSVAEMLDKLSGTLRGKDIYNLSGADLRQVKDTMTALMYSVTNANKAFSMGKDKLISQTAQDWAAGMRQVDHKAAGWRTLGRRFEMWQMTPDTWFNYSCGYAKGNVGQEIQKAFVRGEERMMEVQREYYQMYRDFTESKTYAKELKGLMNEQKKKRVFWGLHDEAGNEVKTSRGIMLQAYMLLCQKDSFESLQLGGFSLPDQDVYYSGNVKGAFGDMDETAMLSEAGGASYRDLQHDRDVLLDKLSELGTRIETTPEAKKPALAMEIREAETQVRDIQSDMKSIADQAGKKLLALKDNIEGQLTPLERQLVERAHDWYSHTGELMADVFEQMYGYRPVLIDGYTPIHRDADTIKTDIRDMAGAAKAFNLENSSFTIDRVKNAQPILLTDFFQELNNQKEKMSRYVGFAQVQKDFGKIWKTRVSSNGMTINKLVAAKFGTGDTGFGVSGTKYVENYIADIAGGHKSEDVLSDLYGNYAAATLRLNPRVAVSQAASIPTAASVVGWKSMAAGFAKGLPKAGSTKFRNDLAARNVWFWQRYRGEGGSTELSDIRMKGNVIEKVANSSVGKKLFNWCQEVDVFSTGSIMWYAAEDYVKTSRGLTEGMDGFENAVNEVYTDIIRKSQPNYTTTERADLLRDTRAHMKLLTMFKTQSSQNLNLLLEANGEFIRMKQDLKNGRNGVTAADLKAAGVKLANASTGVFLGGTASFVALRTIVNFIMGTVNPYRDKDTDEVTLEGTLKGMGKEMLSSLAGTVAMGGQVYDLVMSVISGDSYYGLSDNAISSISGLLENTQKVIANALDEDKEITGAQLWKMANSWCQALGIPGGNAKKMYDMLEMYITGVRDGTLGQYPSDKTTSNQYRERVVRAVLGGETERADNALAILFAKSGGDTDEEIQKDIASGMRTYLKHKYEKGEVSDTEAEKIMAYTGTDDPEGTRERWDFLIAHPDMEASRVSDNLVAAYNQRGDIDEDVFLAAWQFAKSATADKDSKGKTISGSKKKKVVDYVQKLNLTKQQKKRLYELLDVGTTKDTPWG